MIKHLYKFLPLAGLVAALVELVNQLRARAEQCEQDSENLRERAKGIMADADDASTEAKVASRLADSVAKLLK